MYSVPPGYRRTAPVKRPKLDGFTEIIDAWLREDLDRPRKQRHTAKRTLDRLRDEQGLAKNGTQLFSLFGLGNLFLVRRRLMA